VVANLLSNSVKYSQSGGEIVMRAALEERGGEDWAIFAVTDEGIGIPVAELDHVFDPYFRGTNVPPSIKGTGVGLAGTRHIVEQHGGEVEVESVQGASTTVTVRLPLLREGAELVES